MDLSGITTTLKDLPTTNYEVEFEAQRVMGTDFFVGYTFPVGDSACSLILGGWEIDVRFEMEVSKPMGFATYQTVSKIKNARIKKLIPNETPSAD